MLFPCDMFAAAGLLVVQLTMIFARFYHLILAV
jgi:hypothetical protein